MKNKSHQSHNNALHDKIIVLQDDNHSISATLNPIHLENVCM